MNMRQILSIAGLSSVHATTTAITAAIAGSNVKDAAIAANIAAASVPAILYCTAKLFPHPLNNQSPLAVTSTLIAEAVISGQVLLTFAQMYFNTDLSRTSLATYQALNIALPLLAGMISDDVKHGINIVTGKRNDSFFGSVKNTLFGSKAKLQNNDETPIGYTPR